MPAIPFRIALSAVFSTALLLGAAETDAREPAGTIIVLNKSGADASLIDRKTGKEIVRVPTGVGPHEVAVSPDGKTAVVADYGERSPGSTLTVIDLPSKSVRKTIDLEKYQRPHGIMFYKGGKLVLVTAEQQRKLLLVDIDSGRVVQAIDTEQDVSHMVAASDRLQRAYVANIRGSSVSVVDLKEGKLIKIVPTGAGAEGVDIAPDGKEVWITNRAADTLTVLDADTLEALETLPCGDFPIRVKFTPDGRHVLVSNARSGDVAVFDAKQRKEIRRISMQATAVEEADQRLFGTAFGESPVPVGILIPPDGRHAYVANTNADIITVIDLASWEIAGRLKAGKEPDGLAYSPLELAATDD